MQPCKVNSTNRCIAQASKIYSIFTYSWAGSQARMPTHTKAKLNGQAKGQNKRSEDHKELRLYGKSVRRQSAKVFQLFYNAYIFTIQDKHVDS